MKYIAGVDIGGHNVRTAICTATGEIVTRRRDAIDRGASSAQINIDRVIVSIEAALTEAGVPDSNLECVSLAVPGMVDPRSGHLRAAPNVPHWYDLPLYELLKRRFSARLYADNDANMAALGEYWKGAARHCSTFFFVALGTGIGGGAFVNGRIVQGRHFAAGEVGYLVLQPFGDQRRIGDLGWLESVASGLAIGKTAGQEAARVFERAAAGDGSAQEVLKEVYELLALAVVNITAVLDPEMIVIGGGMSSQGERLLEPVRRRSGEFGLQIAPLVVSHLGEDAQLFGTVYAALSMR